MRLQQGCGAKRLGTGRAYPSLCHDGGFYGGVPLGSAGGWVQRGRCLSTSRIKELLSMATWPQFTSWYEDVPACYSRRNHTHASFPFFSRLRFNVGIEFRRIGHQTRCPDNVHSSRVRAIHKRYAAQDALLTRHLRGMLLEEPARCLSWIIRSSSPDVPLDCAVRACISSISHTHV